MASIYRRGNVWWIKYYLPHRTKPVRRSLETGNKRVAESKLKALEYRLETGQLHTSTDTALGAFLEEYLEHFRITHPDTTYRNLISTLRCIFGQCCPTLQLPENCSGNPPEVAPIQADKLEEITPHQVSDFLRLRREKDGISAKTANNARAILHAVFNWAIEHKGFRPACSEWRNPISKVKRYREQQPRIDFLSSDQIRGQLGVLEGYPQMQTMVAVLIYAGLRRAGLMWLTTDDVDLSARLIRVRAKTVDGEFWEPKTRTDRAVPISSSLLEHITGYRRHTGDCPWQFPSPEGCRWDGDNWSHRLKDINEEHGLPWSALDFRHTFGSCTLPGHPSHRGR